MIPNEKNSRTLNGRDIKYIQSKFEISSEFSRLVRESFAFVELLVVSTTVDPKMKITIYGFLLYPY